MDVSYRNITYTGSEEGFLAGISSGAAIAAALKVAAELGEGKNDN